MANCYHYNFVKIQMSKRLKYVTQISNIKCISVLRNTQDSLVQEYRLTLTQILIIRGEKALNWIIKDFTFSFNSANLLTHRNSIKLCG